MSNVDSRLPPPPKVDTGATTSYSLQGIISATKGKTGYKSGESFLLHVFWETPSLEAARELLAALQRCAVATHRDTPCVPTYFFRITTNDIPLCAPTPQRVGEHPQIKEARRKISFGIPLSAVQSDFKRRGFDLSLLDMADDDLLPENMRNVRACTLECTEIYLDERGMMEHAGSRDYLAAYGAVLNPQLTRGQPSTVRLGTPTFHLQERMLEPILKEIVIPLESGCTIWTSADSMKSSNNTLESNFSPLGIPGSLFLSLDIENNDIKMVTTNIPFDLRSHCTTLVAFPHQLRPETTRILAVLPVMPNLSLFVDSLTSLKPARGELHIHANESEVELVRSAFQKAELQQILVNVSEFSGYALHSKAQELHVESSA